MPDGDLVTPIDQSPRAGYRMLAPRSLEPPQPISHTSLSTDAMDFRSGEWSNGDNSGTEFSVGAITQVIDPSSAWVSVILGMPFYITVSSARMWATWISAL
jgi:hypothetical protein